ncbi:MAG: pyridoxamine 5'-phosphate oxidase family protein [Chloroflexota bacterium]
MSINEKTEKRLQEERNIWMATVRRDGRPHLVPVWFIWFNNLIYIGMQPGSVKAKNLAQNDKMALSLESGSDVVICEGTAVLMEQPYPDALLKLFNSKYGWDMINDPVHNLFYEVTPAKWLIWTSGDAE